MPITTVLLVDDHETVRHGLRMVLEAHDDLQVVGEAPDGTAALAEVVALRPRVVVLDISMPSMSGLLAARALKEKAPDVAIVALTRHGDDAYVQELFAAGASGYVLKQSPSTELLHAIRAAAAGQHYLDASIAARAADNYMTKHARPAVRPPISERETAVLRLIVIGYSNKEVAAALDISVKTVEVHKANAMRKLGFRGRIDVVRYGVLNGWLHDS